MPYRTLVGESNGALKTGAPSPRSQKVAILVLLLIVSVMMVF
jgi:hypothetical protein